MNAWVDPSMAMTASLRTCMVGHRATVVALMVGAHAVRAGAWVLARPRSWWIPKVFRVCADPRNLPFSDEAGEGFENKLAEMFAQKLGEPTSYTYYPQVIGFVRNTLNALRCDVIMGVAVGDDLVQTTKPVLSHDLCAGVQARRRTGRHRLA